VCVCVCARSAQIPDKRHACVCVCARSARIAVIEIRASRLIKCAHYSGNLTTRALQQLPKTRAKRIQPVSELNEC